MRNKATAPNQSTSSARAQGAVRPQTTTHGSGAVRPGPTFEHLKLQLHCVICEKTTKELFNADDMTVVGIEASAEVTGSEAKMSLRGKAKKGNTVALGKFRKDDRRAFNTPQVLARLPLGTRHGEWPRNAHAWIVMFESDRNATGKVVSAAVDAIDDQVVKYVASGAAALAAGALAGSAIGSAIPLPGLGTALGAAAGAATAAVLSAIKKAKLDDVFPTQAVKCSLRDYPSQPGEIEGSRQTLDVFGHGGHYRLIVSWAVE